MSNSGAIAPLNFPKQRFLGRASLSHPLNFPNILFLTNHREHRERAIAPPQLPNSELLAAALRYRIPSTPQTAIPRSRLRYRTSSTSQTFFF
ncbi:hypothetical protein [Dolichospermum sp. UHCC 0259]|uniref:hypothetical protein n=1 Tax=Dolichospermum sp. UHCC 0259 TaxID=2590010 RepID=UPI00144882F4|nr:hypothetical protein [Dolichospermum sp. UHCC 0259]MTJ46426.1 hypothetical protein [Dolichospermum sp. UHCC 0259]